jgi:hypothetical protein
MAHILLSVPLFRLRAQLDFNFCISMRSEDPGIGLQAKGEKSFNKGKRFVLIYPQGNLNRKKSKEFEHLHLPFFLSSSNTIWIDSIGSFPGLRLKE